MEVRAAIRGQDHALRRDGCRRDHQMVGPAFGTAAVYMRQQSSVDLGRCQVVGLDWKGFENVDEELGTGGPMTLTCRRPLSTKAGNHDAARSRQSASVITGGPPGTRPSAATGAKYLRTVLRSKPKLSAIWAWERPAYQCT